MVSGSAGVGAKLSEEAAQTARLMLYSLLAIVLMAMDHRGQYVPRLRSLASYLVEPIYHVIDWPVQSLRGVFSYFQSTRALLRDNERLEQTLLSQRGDLQQLDALREENERLRGLLEGAEAVEYAYQFAELISVDLDPFAHRVVIDRGASRGVTHGQAVIDGQGVMGQVEDVQRHFSTVRLISDPNHALPVQINRTGLRTVAFGTGDTARLNLPSVPREADVREGDLVVTSGLGDRFPGGYPVAVIERIDRQEGQMFAVVEARPLAALDRGREVLLVEAPEPDPEPAVEPESVVVETGGEAGGEAETEAEAQTGAEIATEAEAEVEPVTPLGTENAVTDDAVTETTEPPSGEEAE